MTRSLLAIRKDFYGGRRDEVQTYHERSEAGISPSSYALVGSSFWASLASWPANGCEW